MSFWREWKPSSGGSNDFLSWQVAESEFHVAAEIVDYGSQIALLASVMTAVPRAEKRLEFSRDDCIHDFTETSTCNSIARSKAWSPAFYSRLASRLPRRRQRPPVPIHPHRFASWWATRPAVRRT